MKRPVTLAALVLLTGCQTGPRPSNLSPLPGPGGAQLTASAAVSTSVPVQVSAPVTAAWTLHITSRLDMCVLPGRVTLIRNSARTFTHGSALTFTAAGTFTVFPRQQVQGEITDPVTRAPHGRTSPPVPA